MFVKALVAACLVVLSSACAVDPGRSEATGTTEQGILLACTGAEIWTRYWYDNGIEVGREDCDCDGTVTPHGTLSGAYTQVVGPTCTSGGGGGGGGGGGDGCLRAPAGVASPNSAPPTCP